MGVGKPCLGFPSRTAAIRSLRADGLDTRAIANKVGCTVSIVSSLEYQREGRSVEPTPFQSVRKTSLASLFTQQESLELRRAAAARDVSVEQLVRSIIQTVVAESLIDAVLDDREPVRRRA